MSGQRFRAGAVGSFGLALATAAALLVAPVASASVTGPTVVDEVPVATTVVDDATYAKIRGAAPDVPGESDAGSSGFSGVVARAAAAAPPNIALPYDSTYSVQYSLQSGKRWQTPTTGRACVYIRSSRNGVGITVSILTDGGSSYGRASFPQDGVTRQYCFGSLSKQYVYHIYIVKPAQQDFPATGNVTVTA